MTRIHFRLEQRFECYKWNLFSSVHLRRHESKVSVLSSLSLQEYKWLSEYESTVLLCYVPLVTIWSNEKAYIWRHWSSKQAGSERKCPHVHLGQPIYTLYFLPPCLSTFTCFLSSFSAPLQSLVEFRRGLLLPGHLGWWSPLPQGRGRPPGLLLQKIKLEKEIKIQPKMVFIIKLNRGQTFQTGRNTSAFRKNNENPEEGTTTSCSTVSPYEIISKYDKR